MGVVADGRDVELEDNGNGGFCTGNRAADEFVDVVVGRVALDWLRTLRSMSVRSYLLEKRPVSYRFIELGCIKVANSTSLWFPGV